MSTLPDDSRQAADWAGVRAFRAAAARLGDPAPGLLAAASLPDDLVHSLAPALPLVDFSPFDALPGVPLDAEGGSTPTAARAPGQPSPPPLGDGLRPRRPEPVPPAPPPKPEAAPPVFSLRRSGRPLAGPDRATRQPAAAPSGRDAPQAASRPAPDRLAATATPAAERTSPPHATRQPSPAAPPPQPTASQTPAGSTLAAIGALADDLLAARREAVRHMPDALREPQSAPSEPASGHRGRQFGFPSSTAPGEPAAPRSTSPLGGASRRQSAPPEVTSAHQTQGRSSPPSAFPGEPSTPRSPALTFPGGPQSAPRSTSPLGGASGPQSAPRSTTPLGGASRGQSAPPEAASAPRERGLSSPPSTRAMKDATEPEAVAGSSAASRLPDADALADLVNEALVELARRHGVDLS